ncbi:hypothetical protein, partial [Xanthomonas arboricola]|uniref:hypothetical protein n=1 Tax=Xanthomonas arboricola TaxID=56448 RepID=UPI001E630873
MPLKVPRRHPRKHHRLVSVAERNAEGLLALQILRNVTTFFGDMTAGKWLTDYIGHEVRRHQHVLEALLADQQWQRWERGVASGGGTVWRHGCRHRASRDGFT